jgi:glycosyltransferase involved in cell wall biosynthesis
MRKYLSRLKREQPWCRVVVDMPTFPYDGEDTHWTKRMAALKDRYNRGRIARNIDRIVTNSMHDSIWGIETICVPNGFDVDAVPMVRPTKPVGKEIALIGVGNWMPYHALERVIDGMRDYYAQEGKRPVILHVVGSGESLGVYRRHVKRAGLEDRVVFHGLLTGTELDKVYEMADIGVSSLGYHRIGVQLASTLKSREYLARGLPVITATPIDVLPPDFPYCHSVPDTADPVDLNQLIAFHDSVYSKGRGAVVSGVRDFARATIDMRAVMQPVIDYVSQARPPEGKETN